MSARKTRPCTLCPNQMEGHGLFFTNPHHINFIRRARHEFRSEYGVCEECHTSITEVYEIKLRHSKEKLRAKLIAAGHVSNPSTIPSIPRRNDGNATTSSSVAAIQRASSIESQSTKVLLSRTESSTTGSTESLTPSLLMVSSQVQSQEISQTSEFDRPKGSVTTGAQAVTRVVPESPLNTEPSTSAAAAARKRPAAADPWDDIPSPAVLNGSRLPHIQPILKRRKFFHANRDIMKIYLAGITER